jgi:hypothetical protein
MDETDIPYLIYNNRRPIHRQSPLLGIAGPQVAYETDLRFPGLVISEDGVVHEYGHVGSSLVVKPLFANDASTGRSVTRSRFSDLCFVTPDLRHVLDCGRLLTIPEDDLQGPVPQPREVVDFVASAPGASLTSHPSLNERWEKRDTPSAIWRVWRARYEAGTLLVPKEDGVAVFSAREGSWEMHRAKGDLGWVEFAGEQLAFLSYLEDDRHVIYLWDRRDGLAKRREVARFAGSTLLARSFPVFANDLTLVVYDRTDALSVFHTDIAAGATVCIGTLPPKPVPSQALIYWYSG